MTVQPVLPLAILLVIAAALVALRALTLRDALDQPDGNRVALWRWCGVTAAVLLLIVAAVRPAVAAGERENGVAASAGADTNVFLVVDRSVDSAVEDFDGASRMAGIRDDIDALIDRYPRARFALLAFASRPALDWPLSEDVFSLQPVVAGLAPYPGAYGDDASQVNAAAAATVLRYQLIAARQQFPDSPNLVFYFGSGAGGSRAPQGEFDPVAGSVDGGAVYGYGTAAPAAEGASPLDEAALRDVAEQLGVAYTHRQPERPLPGAPAADGAGETRAPAEAAARIELYWVFSALAAALLLVEIYLSLRDFRRSRPARRQGQP